MTKVLVNGNWVGVIGNPSENEKKLKNYRRSALISIYTSIHWNIKENTIYIYTDSGRLCRPIFYLDSDKNKNLKKPSYDKKPILERLETNNFTWEQLVSGFAERKDKLFNIKTKNTKFVNGIGKFVDWFKEYHKNDFNL